MMHTVKQRLAYEIYDRRVKAGFTHNSDTDNWAQAEDMITRVIEGKDSIDSLSAYLSDEDYQFIEGHVKVVKLPKDMLREGGY